MLTFSQLSKRRQARFLIQLVELLEAYKKRAGYVFRYSSVTPPITAGPSLFIMDNELLWEFDFPDQAEGMRHQAELTLLVPSLWDDEQDTAGDINTLLKKRLIMDMKFNCSCIARTSMYSPPLFCQHIAAAFEFMRKRLERATTEDAVAWLDSCIAVPEDVGRHLVEMIAGRQENEKAAPVEGQDCRVVWRINTQARQESAFELEMVLQRPKGRGGWTVGKRVREPIENLPEEALRNTHDRMLALICDAYFGTYSSTPDPGAMIQILEILQGCPHVVWNAANYPPAKIHRGQVAVQLVDSGESYEPHLTLDGQPLNTTDLVDMGKGRFCGILVDDEEHRIVYFTLTSEQARLVALMDYASSRGARFDRESAERFSKLLSTGTPQKKLALQIPESLAGPDVNLPPAVELHLEPKERQTLEARLRVACTVLDEPPTPGIGSERTLVHTPAGAYHIVRDLTAEAAAADKIANDLQLGDFQFDGPYCWQLNGLEESLKIIERVRTLGEAAPPVCWPKSKPLRLVGDITPQSLRVRLTSDRDWFGIDGELQLEGLHVPLAELMVAIRNGGRFVPLGDNQFATISDQLRARMTMIDDVSSVDGGALRMARAAAPLVDEAIGLDIPAERDQKWQEAIERLTDWQLNPPEPPSDLKATLRDYQVAGYQWLAKLSHWGLGGCLADDMGLGKTVQTLGVLLDRANQGPTLIVAPTSVGVNWTRETERFAPSLRAHLYREHDRDQLIQSAGPGDLIITSYQMLQRDIDRVASRSWATLVLDEAQYIKNFQTKTNQAVRRLDVDWCVALSGTPLENHLGELWSLMRVLSPGLLGSWERFRERFGEPIERDKDSQRLKALGQVVRPFILRRTKQEVLTELPPRTEVVLSAELSPAERKRYDAARMAALAELTSNKGEENDQQKRIRVLAWLTRLRQLSCHPGLVDPRWTKSSAKLDLFLETVNELRDNDHRALVFSQFVQHLSLVRAALNKQGIKYQYLDGSTPPTKRQEAVDAFQRGEGDLFLISLKAGGTGLNLTAADYVLHLDPWWNPAVEDQATDRAHRIGQLRPVTVYRLVAKDTIEEQILSLHESKRELLAGVLDGADRAAKMSTQELVDLIRDTHQLTSHT